MVQTPGASLRARGIRPLNEPRPVEARTDADNRPTTIRKNKEWLAVVGVDEVWRVDDEWWRKEPIARTFYSVLLEDGRHTTLLLDERSGAWYMVKA